MTNEYIKRIVLTQLAIDLNCEREDFVSLDNKTICLTQGIDFCHCVCFGDATVAIVDPRIEEFMEEFLHTQVGYRCFDMPQLSYLNHEFAKYNKCIGMIEEFYLPDLDKVCIGKPEFKIKILEGEDIAELYQDHRFGMALSYEQNPSRSDVLAIVGYQGEKIMGIACATDDTDLMWQIGVDVVEEFRRKKVATILTRILTEEILKRGKIPYYGTSWSNMASKNVAIQSGYHPVWVEMDALENKRGL